jgi:hypothetical protein
MFTFHIYLGDTCIGEVIADSPNSALAIFGGEGLTAVLIPKGAPIPEGWAHI